MKMQILVNKHVFIEISKSKLKAIIGSLQNCDIRLVSKVKRKLSDGSTHFAFQIYRNKVFYGFILGNYGKTENNSEAALVELIFGYLFASLVKEGKKSFCSLSKDLVKKTIKNDLNGETLSSLVVQ